MAIAEEHGGGDPAIWGTWEELLLACAVNRHGTRSWDSVAGEVQSRSPAAAARHVTSHSCRQRFRDLHRRFGGGDDDPPPEVPWIDDLRRLRVAELRREVERYDVSIVSRQLEVKRLREERERKEGGGSDLKKAAKEAAPASGGDERISGEDSTDPKAAGDGRAAGPEEREPDPAAGGEEEAGGEGSCESAAEGEGESASLLKRRRRGRRRKMAAGGGDRIGGGSGPLMGFLEMIRSSECGSVFERRLESQETARYRSVIRRHVDLEIVRTKLGNGAYENLEFYRDLLLLCTNAIVFFPKGSPESVAAVRLRELVSNEMSNSERTSTISRVANEPTPPPPVAKESTPPPKVTIDPETKMLPAPLVACKKRSPMSAKPAVPPPLLPALVVATKEEKKPDVDHRGENLVLAKKGTRGLRSTKSRGRNTTLVKRPNTSPAPVPAPSLSPPPDEKTADVLARTEKNSGAPTTAAARSAAKKKGAATFLNRINRGSPPASNGTDLLETLKGSSSANVGKGSEQKKAAVKGDGKKDQVSRPRVAAAKAVKAAAEEGAEEGAPVKRSVGRPPKRAAPPPVPPPAKRAKEEAEAKPPKPRPQVRKRGRR